MSEITIGNQTFEKRDTIPLQGDYSRDYTKSLLGWKFNTTLCRDIYEALCGYYRLGDLEAYVFLGFPEKIEGIQQKLKTILSPGAGNEDLYDHEHVVGALNLSIDSGAMFMDAGIGAKLGHIAVLRKNHFTCTNATQNMRRKVSPQRTAKPPIVGIVGIAPSGRRLVFYAEKR